MGSKKIRVLGIAPYQGMKNTMISAAQNREDLELVTYIGDLNTGLEIVTEHLAENYDVIISRGGTAELIKQHIRIPVIEIPLSMYDILRAIKLAENYAQRYAIVGFGGITSTAHLLCDLLGYDLDIITLHNEKEVPHILEGLKKKGYHMVLCDMITDTVAKQQGFHSILITSGVESIESAFDQAIKLCEGYAFVRGKNHMLTEALKNQTADTIILAADGSLFFSTYTKENAPSILTHLRSLLDSLHNTSFTKSFHLIENTLYAVSMHSFKLEHMELFSFSIEPNPVPSGSSKYGLRFTDFNEMKDQYYNSFYRLTSAATHIEGNINQMNLSSLPVMIIGEIGTGKNQAAALLYMNSSAKDNPFIVVDCQLINDKNWDFLTHHYNSPFCDNDNTIFICNIHSLSMLQRKQLLSLMIDTNLHKRNRVILSSSLTHTNQDDPAQDFINHLPCTTLYMPPLRELSEDLASASSLYLNTLNMEFSKQLIGFEPDALELLRSYHWPFNFIQLKRVLAELVMLTSTPYIKAETVKTVLMKEPHYTCSTSKASSSFDMNRPLSDMIQEIVKTVLSECDGNQTKAAGQLGISRTTLWRYLK